MVGDPLSGKGCGSPNDINFSYCLFTYVLFIHFVRDIINGEPYPAKQLDHFLGN